MHIFTAFILAVLSGILLLGVVVGVCELPPIRRLLRERYRRRTRAVLELLRGGALKGREIRDELNYGKGWRERISGPLFYKRMARLEDRGFVAGWYRVETVHGQLLKQRWYRITECGREWLCSDD